MNDEPSFALEATDPTAETDYEVDVSNALSGWELLSEDPPGYDVDQPTRPAAWPHEPDEYTYIGVDLGVRNLLVAAPAGAGVDRYHGSIRNAVAVDGDVIRALYEEAIATIDRLRKATGVDTQTCWTAMRAYTTRLRDRIDAAIARFLAFCDEFEEPLTVVLEDFGYSRESLASCARTNADPGTWLLPQSRYRLAAELYRRDVRLTYVDPARTTRSCHACGERGVVRDRFRCRTDGCPVGRVDRDRNAAVNVARRGAWPPV